MAIFAELPFAFTLWMFYAIFVSAYTNSSCCSRVPNLSRNRFPPNFVFGTTSSSYQYEGAISEGGRGPTNWDVYSHTPGKILDGSNGDIAVDHYHRYKEDIRIMRDMGMDAYRFSIAWSRIYPNGKGEEPNKEGIMFYNNLIDNVIENGMQPYVTLNHFDLPQSLEEDYGGWLSSSIIDDFAKYANVCFASFGDRVKHWITFNEPHLHANYAYNVGVFPPQHCSADVGICDSGNSSSEIYVVGHHFLLAHAIAVDVYRKGYKTQQGGRIGITLDSRWFEPLTLSDRDIYASLRALDFELGWFMDPLTFGEYPASMRRIVANRLPTFTTQQRLLVKGSIDFVGINHYTTFYATEASTGYRPTSKNMKFNQVGYYKDTRVQLTDNRNGELIGPNVNGQYVVPWGMHKLLGYIRSRYINPVVFITENGISDPQGSNSELDDTRVNFMKQYLSCLSTSIREGSNVQAYFVWSLLDNWEWNQGYTKSYGMYYIDREKDLMRRPKSSAIWYKEFLKRSQFETIATF